MMRTVVAMIAGTVVGIAVGATVIAPGLAPPATPAHAEPEAPRRLVPVPDDKTGERVRWTLTSTFPARLPHLGGMARHIDRAIARISDGHFELRLAEDGNAAGDLYAAVAAGARDAVFASPALWHERVPALQLFAGIPFGPDPDAFLAWFYAGGGKDLYDGLHHHQGVHGLLCGMTAGAASGWFRRPAHTVGDLKGLHIRIDGLGAEVLRRVGAKPVSMADDEVPAAFEAGTLDAAALALPSIDGKLALEKVARHYYFPGWHRPFSVFELIVNLKLWEALSPSDKARLETICGDTLHRGLAETEAAQFAALKDLQTRGVEIRRWPADVLEALHAAWTKTADQKTAADPDFAKTWAALEQFREEYAIWRELGRL